MFTNLFENTKIMELRVGGWGCCISQHHRPLIFKILYNTGLLNTRVTLSKNSETTKKVTDWLESRVFLVVRKTSAYIDLPVHNHHHKRLPFHRILSQSNPQHTALLRNNI
jgi:hypothetical protein